MRRDLGAARAAARIRGWEAEAATIAEAEAAAAAADAAATTPADAATAADADAATAAPAKTAAAAEVNADLPSTRVRRDYDTCVAALLSRWKLPVEIVQRIQTTLYADTRAPWVPPEDYAAVMVVVSRAADALAQIRRNDIHETYSSFPHCREPLELVAEAVCILLGVRGMASGHRGCQTPANRGQKEHFWQALRVLINSTQSKMGVIESMFGYDLDAITDEMARRMRPLLSHPALVAGSVERVSRPDASFMQWVRAAMLYHNTCYVYGRLMEKG